MDSLTVVVASRNIFNLDTPKVDYNLARDTINASWTTRYSPWKIIKQAFALFLNLLAIAVKLSPKKKGKKKKVVLGSRKEELEDVLRSEVFELQQNKLGGLRPPRSGGVQTNP